jgi:hypothetical protein
VADVALASMRCACIVTRFGSDGSLPDLRHAAHMFRKLRQPLLLLQFLGPSLRNRSDGPSKAEPLQKYNILFRLFVNPVESAKCHWRKCERAACST